MVGSSVWAVWVHAAVAAVKVQLQAARPLEMAPLWHLCSQHDCMRRGLHCGGVYLVPSSCSACEPTRTQAPKVPGFH